MTVNFEMNYDLLGDPIPANAGEKGRPEHIPTRENRNKIILLLALDWTNKKIANSLGISLPTLRKHYFSELAAKKVARDRVDGARVQMLWDQSRQGNVAAMKEYSKLLEAHDIKTLESNFDKPEKKLSLGKKEMQNIEAETAGQDHGWGNDLETTGISKH